jgi:hypothetical protein
MTAEVQWRAMSATGRDSLCVVPRAAVVRRIALDEPAERRGAAREEERITPPQARVNEEGFR